MLVMVVLGVGLRFLQESRADTAAAKLKAMISVTATVVRDGQPRELPLSESCPATCPTRGGRHDSGRPAPCDLQRLVRHQSSLTGESLPVEKFDSKENDGCKVGPGTQKHLLSGYERGKRRRHGRDRGNGFRTYLGSMAQSLVGQPPPTSFDRGVNRFTWLMIYFMAVLVPLVFIINGSTLKDVGQRRQRDEERRRRRQAGTRLERHSSSRWPWP